MSLIFPEIDPVAFSVGPLVVRWYALAYIAGFLGGWGLASVLVQRYAAHTKLTTVKLDDLLLYVVVGIILGGRVGYVLIYNLPYYFSNPADILQLWHGGMSFHGGLIGSLIGMWLYARKSGFKFLEMTDIAAAVTPIGIFFGRLANFVNGELFGRVTTSPFGMVFPMGGDMPRHPSQLYEAATEGLLLFVVLMLLATKRPTWDRYGLLSGVFLIGYGLSRFVVEFAREPDMQLGLLFMNMSMGQLLCLPMIAVGAGILYARSQRA